MFEKFNLFKKPEEKSMDHQEFKKLFGKEIDDIRKKQEEMLVLVQKLWKAEKWRRFWTIFRYAIYIGILIGAFYFLTPYIEKFIGIIREFQTANNPQDLQKILEQLQMK